MADHKKRTHALLSASGASRWLNCTPSARLEDSIADGAESNFAREGTFAHELAELKIRNHLDPKDKKISDQLKKKRENSFYSKELDEYVNVYVGYVIERYNKAKSSNPKAKLLIEERLDLSEIIKEGFGTGDAAIIDSESIEVIDLKFGRGVKVDADNNDQLGIYGLGYISAYEIIYGFTEVKLTIVQPRLDHISTFDWSAEDLVKWGLEEVKPTADLAYDGKGELRAGTWCKFCKMKPTCKALKDHAVGQMKKDFSKAVPKNSESDKVLNVAEIAEAFKSVKIVEDWIKSVKEHVLSKALSGTKFPDLKLVRGKANRKWIDEEEARKKLMKSGFKTPQILNTKLKGISDIEKLVGKKELEEMKLLEKPLGAPTVVPSTDKRPEYDPRPTLEEDFAEEIDIDF